MTSQRRRRRKKAEKKHQVVQRYRPYEPPAIHARDTRLVSQLEAAVDRHLDLSGIELEQFAGTASVSFGRKKAPLVYVFSDEAVQVHGVRRIPGDFLSAGEHWTKLHALLLEIQGVPDLPTATAGLARSLTSFPSSLPPELISAALEASAQIPADLRVFPCPVVLEGVKYQVRFEPIRRHPRLVVPFRLRRSDDEIEIEAALDLTATAGPIAVLFDDSAHETRVVEAWPVALLAFADLIGAHAASRPDGAGRPAPKREVPPSSGSHQTEPPRGLPRRTDQRSPSARSSDALTPVGQTANHHGSFVVGHRRHLPLGQTCTDDARAAARLYGIDLPPGWTWVQPHERGIPEGFVLRYAWSLPRELADVASLSST